MTDWNSYHAGRNGGFADADTNMGEFRWGQNARRIQEENERSAAARAPAPAGPGGGGAALLGPLFLLPFLVAMAVSALLPALLLKYFLPARAGVSTPGFLRRYKISLYAAVACHALPMLVLVLGPRLNAGAFVGLYSIGLPVAGYITRRQLPLHFPGAAGYVRACLVALLTSMTATAITLGAGLAAWSLWGGGIDLR